MLQTLLTIFLIFSSAAAFFFFSNSQEPKNFSPIEPPKDWAVLTADTRMQQGVAARTFPENTSVTAQPSVTTAAQRSPQAYVPQYSAGIAGTSFKQYDRDW